MTILPIITYRSTVKTTFNNTQLLKFVSIERRASAIVGTPVVRIIENIEQQITFMVTKCINGDFGHQVLDTYFNRQNHQRGTRRDGFVLNYPKINLETARPGFYYGGVKIFNNLPLHKLRDIWHVSLSHITVRL